MTRPVQEALDHLLLGIGDLDRGVEWVHARTGVAPAIGGSHPGMGTRNALLSLGRRQYLEIIAPDPGQQTFTFRTDLRELTEPRLIWWAASTEDADGLVAAVRAANRPVFGPLPGSRATPAGALLRWRTVSLSPGFSSGGVDPVPFFIEWDAATRHPGEDAPAGCELSFFALEHPDPSAVQALLEDAGLAAEIVRAPQARLVATIASPRGLVVLE